MTAITRVRRAGSSIDAVVTLPGSKSAANRALVIAALADGESTLVGVPMSDDVDACRDALIAMGVPVSVDDGTVSLHGGDLGSRPLTVDARLAGTTSRFLIAAGSLRSAPLTVTGDGPLRSRPMTPLLEALTHLGFRVTRSDDGLGLPVTVSWPDNADIGDSVRLPSDVSSQFISALMMIGPRLPNGLSIWLDGPKVSESYIRMTASVMTTFGAHVEVNDDKVVLGPGGYAGRRFVIEPDFSSAAFPVAAVVMAGGRLRLPNLASASLQGDSRILELAQMMGATVDVDGVDIIVSRDSGTEVAAIDVDMSDCSDLVPAVAMMCTAAAGTSSISGVGFIRHKESDRLGDLASEMGEIGARVDVLADGLVIHGGDALGVGRCDTHHDHRLAMALSLGAMTADHVDICAPDVVSKSWPTYWDAMADIISTESVAS